MEGYQSAVVFLCPASGIEAIDSTEAWIGPFLQESLDNMGVAVDDGHSQGSQSCIPMLKIHQSAILFTYKSLGQTSGLGFQLLAVCSNACMDSTDVCRNAFSRFDSNRSFSSILT